MAIAFRAATTAGNATGGSLTINKPTGTLDNDILILVVYTESSATGITPPTGFTQVGSTQANAGTANMWVSTYWKRAASEGASYSIGNSPSSWRVAALAAFSGCTTSGSPIDASTSHGDTTTAVTAASITTTVANAMVVVTMGNFSGTDQTAGTSGMTLATGGDLGGCEIFYAIQASAGATGTKTFAPGAGTGSDDAVFTLDLLPPSPGVTVNATPAAAGGTGASPTVSITSGNITVNVPAALAGGSGAVGPTVSTSAGVTVAVAAPGAAGAGGNLPNITTTQSATIQTIPGGAGAGGTFSTAGQTANNHLISIGNGYTDANPRASVRTSDNRLWVSSWQFDTYPQGSANGLTQTLRMYKADQTGTPSTFTRMDSAHEAVGVVSWAMAVDGSDLIHIIYTIRASWSSGTGTDNVLAYNTFNTSTGLWGTPVNIETALNITEIGQGDELVALAVDGTGIPHIVYLKSDGTRRRVNYRNRSGGSWSAAVIVDDQTFGSNEKCWHPGIAFDTAGRIVVTWQRGDFNGNTTGRSFIRVSTSGVWGTTHDIAGANTWIGIDQSGTIYIDNSNRYHVSYLDGSVNEYLQYRYSDDQGATWTSNHPAGGTGQGHNPVVGPGPGGTVRYYTHNASTTEITYFQGSGGSGAWGTRTDYETPTGYDCSVNVRWSQYFWNFPLTLDIIYWKSDYPTNGLILGTDAAVTVSALPGQAGSAGAASAITAGVSVTVSALPAASSGSGSSAGVTATSGVTVNLNAPASSGAMSPSETVSATRSVTIASQAASAGSSGALSSISTASGVTVNASPGMSGSIGEIPTVTAAQNVSVSATPGTAGNPGGSPTISATRNVTVSALSGASGGAGGSPAISLTGGVTVNAIPGASGSSGIGPTVATSGSITIIPLPAFSGAAGGVAAMTVGTGVTVGVAAAWSGALGLIQTVQAGISAQVNPTPGGAGGTGGGAVISTTRSPTVLASPGMIGGAGPAPLVYSIAPFSATVPLTLAARAAALHLGKREILFTLRRRN